VSFIFPSNLREAPYPFSPFFFPTADCTDFLRLTPPFPKGIRGMHQPLFVKFQGLTLFIFSRLS
jgi:hypothetical protein